MKDGMEQVQRLTHVRGAAAVGVYLSFFFFLSFLVWLGLVYRLVFSFVSVDEG
jgi:hypothetical protein